MKFASWNLCNMHQARTSIAKLYKSSKSTIEVTLAATISPLLYAIFILNVDYILVN